ncbi:MAG: hypothetical protein IT173_05230 [Acidobacteria bacterium]|nr:hypothetical protein [Acidobacteriota bacterium]
MKVLAISLAFPPLAYPRSIQVARLLKHTLAKTVLFCADESGARIDPSIEPDAEERLKACIRIPVPSGTRRQLTERILYRFVRGAWNQRNLVPDKYGGWGSLVVEKAAKYVEEGNFEPEVLATFAQPFTDHLIGLELKKRLGLPWLAHFSDPWADNPFTPFDARTRERNLALEKIVAEEADALVFTSVETVELFFRKYAAGLREKAIVLPQCYDRSHFLPIDSPPSGPITVRYLGNFYGRRSPQPLIAGLTELYRTDPASIENVRFELIGPGNADQVKTMAASLPAGCVAVRSRVGYQESLALMTSSDGLLIIDAPADISVFLPSKLIDYIGADKPIFGITPKGTAADLITELGGSVANPAQTQQISAGLSQFIQELQSRRSGQFNRPWGKAEVRERFTGDRVSRDFLSMLQNLST